MIKIHNKAYFTIDSFHKYFEGYHIPNQRWNGWAMPYFEKEVADKVILETHSINIKYEEEKERYFVVEEDGFSYYIDKEIIDTEDGEKEVYGIGSGSWIWDYYSLEEVKTREDAIIITKDIEYKIENESIDIDY